MAWPAAPLAGLNAAMTGAAPGTAGTVLVVDVDPLGAAVFACGGDVVEEPPGLPWCTPDPCAW
jgi:hypothetical protein